jgi:hypothetical protein
MSFPESNSNAASDIRLSNSVVMPGLGPGIHVFFLGGKKDVDGRVKPGHDEIEG